MNPLLQRFLIALGAGFATSVAVVGTARNKHKKAKKRRRKKSDRPVVIGTVAKHEAGEDFVPSLTAQQVLQNIKNSGKSFVGFFARKPRRVENDDGSVDDEGSALEPDEIRSEDGSTIKNPKKKSPARSAKGPALTASERRRRRKKRRQATLFESAKESFRQVVKEETSKVVDEKIEQTGLKKAAEVLKQAGEKVGGTVKDAAKKVEESIPDDANEKLANAGKSFLAGARKLGMNIGASVSQAMKELQLPPPDAPPNDLQIDSSDHPDASSSSSSSGATPPRAPLVKEPEPLSSQLGQRQSGGGDADSNTGLSTSSSEPPTDPSSVAEHGAVQPGMSAEELGEKVSDGVRSGVRKIGAFLSGPGNPGYKKGGRVGGGHDRDGAGVVEAKDPQPRSPDPPVSTLGGESGGHAHGAAAHGAPDVGPNGDGSAGDGSAGDGSAGDGSAGDAHKKPPAA